MSPPERIPLAKPELGEREEELVLEVLRSGRLSLGPVQERFERAFAERLGVPDAVAVSSGTAALHLGVRALGWGEGDEVVTTPFSFVASANCLLYEGVTPVFCDVDPVTLNLDPAAAWEAIGERTAGLLPVDILGYPAAIPAFEKIAADGGLGAARGRLRGAGRVDAEGQAVGSRGNLASLRLLRQQAVDDRRGRHARRLDPELASARAASATRAARPDMDWVDHDRLGFNYRLTEVQAALGIAQLERLDELLAAARSVASLYRERLAELDSGRRPARATRTACCCRAPTASPSGGAGSSTWSGCPAGADRDAVVADLAQRGVKAKAVSCPAST